MSDKQITITISGPCGSGKTTLAQALYEFLRYEGFSNVSVDDYDLTHTPSLWDREVQPARMEAVSPNRVDIVTVQTQNGESPR